MNSNQKGTGNELRAAALEYANKGIPVFPLKPGDKTPIHTGGFYNATTDPTIISQWWDEHPNANIGMPTGHTSGIVVVDIDNKGENGFSSIKQWHADGFIIPVTRVVLTPNHGSHLYFYAPDCTVQNKTGLVPGIDIRGDGGYVVIPPSCLSNGKPYRWKDPSQPLAELPEWLLQLLTAKPQPQPILSEFEANIIPNGSRNDTLIRMAGSLRRFGAGEEEIFASLWKANVERCSPPLDEHEVHTIAASAMRWPPVGPEFPLTDSGNAELFAHLNTGELLYDHKQKRWLIWQQHWWAEDRCGEVFCRAKEAARYRQRLAANQTSEEKKKAAHKHALKSEDRSRIEACIGLSKSEPQLSNSGEGWDSQPFALGVANGVVNLQTGQLETGKPSDRISLHTDVAYDPQARCPRWEQFMHEVFQGDAELIKYVQRAVGYSLTGLTSEHIMFICHGNGANGKSVMLRVLCELLGDHAKVTASSTLDTQNKSAIANDVAALKDRRLVWASETEQTSMLNEAKVKQLVHADTVSARFLYRELFTFTPVAKFWLTLNDLPEVRDGSHGMWRSLHVIPFKAEFDGSNADLQLSEKLKAELSGILNWVIKGCLEWQQQGLCPPPEVTNATSEYQVDNDVLAEFLASYCEEGKQYSEPAWELYRAYSQWAANCGLKERDTLRERAFFKRLKTKYSPKRTNKGMVYSGLHVIAPLMEPR